MPLHNPALQALTRCLFLRSARVFLEYIIHTLATLHRQHQVIKISSSTLDLHVLAITDAFEGIVAKATNDLGRQATPSRCLRASTQTSLARWRYRGRWLKRESVTVSSIASIFAPKFRQMTMIYGYRYDLQTPFTEADEAVGALTSGTDSVRMLMTYTT